MSEQTHTVKELEIVYRELSIRQVIDYFVKGYDKEIYESGYSYFIDTAKETIILKVYIEKTGKA